MGLFFNVVFLASSLEDGPPTTAEAAVFEPPVVYSALAKAKRVRRIEVRSRGAAFAIRATNLFQHLSYVSFPASACHRRILDFCSPRDPGGAGRDIH